MTPEEIKTAIKTKFSALLTKAGTSIDAPDLFLTWEAFKAFAQVRVDQTHGGLLFECGPVNWGEGDFFEVSFTRYFYLEVEESWDDLLVRASFSFLPVPKLSQFEISIGMDWGVPTEVTAFIDEAESHQALWEALRQYPMHHHTVFMDSQ
jgi:hypothetical protein